MTFFLGTHRPHWLEMLDVPLFVSRRCFEGRRSMPRARTTWALDSSGFTELALHGEWTMSPREYVALVRRIVGEVGMMAWAAIQDWMCEAPIRAKTGKTTAEHQRLTVESLLELRGIAPEIPWAPVLQGQHKYDYLEHVDMYARAGVALADEPIVGLGSVCRRQATEEVVRIVQSLCLEGIRLHGFGVKTLGLPRLADWLASADSMAWSLNARKNALHETCAADPATKHKNCANCHRFALDWRARAIDGLDARWGS